jgi:hypothetical protein
VKRADLNGLEFQGLNKKALLPAGLFYFTALTNHIAVK